MNIYIGNFSYETTEDQLKTIFEPFGSVDKIAIIKDKISGDSRGFGFVEMPNQAEAQAAIAGITEIDGRTITINEARPQTRGGDSGRSGGGNYRSGGFKSGQNRSRNSY